MLHLARSLVLVTVAFLFWNRSESRADDIADTTRLKQTLDNATDAQRIEALRKVKATGAEAAKLADMLTPMMGDKNGGVQEAASAALARLGIDAAPALAAGMKSADPNIRNRAQQHLVRLGPPAFPALTPLLKHDDFNVRFAAMNIVVQHRQPEMVMPISERLFDANLQIRHMAINYLQQSDKKARPALANVIKTLGDPDGHMRNQSANVIRQLGPEVVPDVAEAIVSGALKDANPESQMIAISLVVASGTFPKSAIPLLTERSKSNHASLRNAALQALAKLLPESAPQLRQLMKDPHPEARFAAVNALQSAGPAAVELLPELMAEIRGGDVNSQNMAAAAVMRIGGRAVPELIRLVKEPRHRDRAVQILENLNGDRPALIVALAEAGKTEPAAVRALRRLGQPAQVPLIELVAEKNPEVKAAALETLSKIGPITSAMIDVKPLLKHPDPAIRGAALRLFVRSIPSRQNDPEFLEPLLIALHDSDWEIRRTASMTLSRIPNDSVGKLVDLMRNAPSGITREEAIVALAFLGPRARTAVKPLEDAVRDPSELRLRKRALWALTRIEPNSNAILVKLMSDADSSVRADAIAAIKPEQVESAKAPLIKALADKSEDVRQAAAKALSSLSPLIARELEPLLLVEDPDHRAAVIQALARYESAPLLKKYLSDDNAAVREAASSALARQGADAYRAIEEALRSKAFRIERAACQTLLQMEDRPDDLIPALIDGILNSESEEPETMAKTVLRINPVFGGRRLAQVAKVDDLLKLLKRDNADIQELACLALAESAKAAAAANPALTEIVKDLKTPPTLLAAAARALDAIDKNAAAKAAPDLATRIVRGVHEKSLAMREQAIADFPLVELNGDSPEAILIMCAQNQSLGEASEWTMLHAYSNSTAGVTAPTFVRVLAITSGRDKRFPGRLTPQAEQALKEHFWRFVREGSPNRRGVDVRPLPDVKAIFPLEQLVWASSAYVALGVLKDDPNYKNHKLQGLTLAEHHAEWTQWWLDWTKARGVNGLWPDLTLESTRTALWPCLINMADYAGDPVVKERFKMLLDLTMIEEEQISIDGSRAGGRGKKSGVGGPLDPLKDILMGQHPRTGETNLTSRAIFWTSSYQAPPAAILLRLLNRPTPEYAITNRIWGGGNLVGFVTPHAILGCESHNPQHNMEPHGYWRRLVFDDGNSISFPLVDNERRHMLHRNVYVTTFTSAEQPAVEITSDLKVAERAGWIFVSNGPAHAALFFQGGYRLDKNEEKGQGRKLCHIVSPVNPHTTILLQANDSRTTGDFDAFQTQILKGQIKANDNVLNYTGDNLPAIEFFRDGRANVGGQPFVRADGKTLESPYLQQTAGEPVVSVRCGAYRAVYDFESTRVQETWR